MNVISSKTRCRLECATATFCGCGKCGGGLITVLGLLLLALTPLARPRESSPLGSVPTCPCPQRAGQPSLNILCFCGTIQNMLSKREVKLELSYQSPPPRPQGMGKTQTYHTPKDLRQPNKRVKTSHDDIHMVWVPPASADAQSPYITAQ
jgi:hypothetical protein